MLRAISLAAVALALLISSAWCEEKRGQEVEGTWEVVRLHHDGKDLTDKVPSAARLVLADQKARFAAGEQSGELGTYEADSRGTPKIIDFAGKDPRTGKAITREGIYKLEGDQLTICVQGKIKDVKERPAKFASEAGSGLILVTFKRSN